MTGYASDGKVFADAGVDVAGKGRSTVYRARDGQGAAAIRDAYYREIQTTDPQMKPDPIGGSRHGEVFTGHSQCHALLCRCGRSIRVQVRVHQRR